MAKHFRNFDKFIAELKHETASFAMFGKTYTFEKKMPAVIPLQLAKYGDEDDIPPRIIFQAARQIFGENTVKELEAHPAFSLDVLTELIRWAFDVINGKDESEEEPVAVTEDDTAAPERKN